MSFTGNLIKLYRVHKLKVLTVGAVAGIAALQYTDLNPVANLFRTPGVQNIENRYSSGGGSKTHLPGASTPRGNSEDVQGNTENAHGIGTDQFREKIGEQKPRSSGFDKAWNSLHYGQDKGK